MPYSFTLEEDAVIAMLPEIRAGLVRNVAETLDDVILNADRTTTNNINADGATISAADAGKGHWLIGYDGLLHLPLKDNASQANDHGAAVSDDMFNEVRAKLGKYGARPSELAWVMDVNTFIRAQGVSQFRTMDKLGPNATVVTGMLGAVEGIPVIVSEQMKLADADGRVTDAGNVVQHGPAAGVQPHAVGAGFPARHHGRRVPGHAEAPDGGDGELPPRAVGAQRVEVEGDAHGAAVRRDGSGVGGSSG